MIVNSADLIPNSDNPLDGDDYTYHRLGERKPRNGYYITSVKRRVLIDRNGEQAIEPEWRYYAE